VDCQQVFKNWFTIFRNRSLNIPTIFKSCPLKVHSQFLKTSLQTHSPSFLETIQTGPMLPGWFCLVANCLGSGCEQKYLKGFVENVLQLTVLSPPVKVCPVGNLYFAFGALPCINAREAEMDLGSLILALGHEGNTKRLCRQFFLARFSEVLTSFRQPFSFQI
jgi:hypothetical protein